MQQAFYAQLFAAPGPDRRHPPRPAGTAQPQGTRAYYNQTIDLEDWLLPVVYQNQPQQLRAPATSQPQERAAFFQREAARYLEPKVAYHFVGRDLDILHK